MKAMNNAEAGRPEMLGVCNKHALWKWFPLPSPRGLAEGS